MNSTARRTLGLLAVGAMTLGGCELVAEFDRSKIDGGSLDGSFPDVNVPDVNQPDSPADTGVDAPVDSGSDAGADATSDAAADASDASTDAASDAGADASDAAADAPDDADAGTAQLDMTPSSNDFLTIAVNSSSTDFTFTVTNNGSVTSGTMATSLTGTDMGEFGVGTDTCNANTLGATLTCTVDVHFSPTSTGAKSATIQVVATPGGTASATLAGTGN
jgi:hypothetical protein